AFPSVNVGTYNVPVSYTISGDASSNYLAPVGGSVRASITAASFSVTFSGDEKVYTASGQSIKVSGTADGDIILYSTDGNSYSSTVPTFTDVGTYTVYAKVQRANYADWTGSATLTITPKQLTVTGTTVDDKTYDRSTSATVLAEGTLQGVCGDDTVTIATVTGTFSDKNAGTGKTVTLAYTLGGTDAGNYTVADGSTTANITPKQLTISGSKVNSKIYDGNATASITVGTPSGVISGDTVTVSASGTFANAQPGANKNVTVTYSLSGADAGNYTAPASQTLTGTIVEAPSMVVNSSADDVDPYDNEVTLREALGVYYKTDGTISGYDGEVAYNTGSNKTITFASGLTTMNPSSGYTLTTTHDGLVIDAKSGRQSNIVFDGQTFIIFTQTGAADVTIKGITFRNLTGSGQGTAYSCTLGFSTGSSCGKTVTLEECTFANNNSSGAASSVAVIGIDSLIKNSTFTGNSGYHSTLEGGFGNMTIQGSTFSQNSAQANGGAVGITYEPSTPTYTLTVINSTFSNNYSSYDGGAIYTVSKKLSISGSTFTSNTAAQSGGAIATPTGGNKVKEISVSGSEFTGNGASGGSGGAMRIENYGEVTLTVTGTTFSNNTATSTGGALFMNGCTFNIGGQSEFSGNSAVNGGGAIRVGYGNGSKITAKFTGNHANGTGAVHGGAILFESNLGKITISDSEFTGNYAVSTSGSNAAFGGAISRLSGDNTGVIEIKDTDFDRNYLTCANGTYGGAVYSNAPTTTISGGSFTANKALSGNGGAIAVSDGNRLSVSGATFGNNEAINAGAIYTAIGTSTISGTFTGNKAVGGVGGAIYTFNTTSTTISGGSFTGNKAASGSGGALYADGAGTMTVSGTASFGSNEAVNGGAIFTTISSTEISGATFNGNKAVGGSGGAIRSNNSGGNSLKLSNSQFSSNTASDSGGALSLSGTAYEISGSTFTSNTSNGSFNNGGAIYSNGGGESSITGSTFRTNVATGTYAGKGGAIHLQNQNNPLTISDSLFSHNQVFAPDYYYAWGGAICRESGSGNLNIYNSTIEGNNATGVNGGNGGGMQTKGGGLYMDGSGNLKIVQCLIADNSLIDGGNMGFGGGIFITNVNAKIYYSTITGNTAKGGNSGGGGIWIHTGAACDLYGSILYNNRHLSGSTGHDAVNNSSFKVHYSLYSSSGILGSVSFDGNNYNIDNGGTVFASGSYQLAANSVAINRTNQGSAVVDGTTLNKDLAGNERKVGASVDYGAYEYQGTSVDAVFAEYDDGDIDVDIDFF
ncbi:MAG: right-handed parallel beta-helix repeat-containing protein, partial [Thermoguttaceae bacterium]|nr:right-handed parallel beta-helix repeat-containing protein [Thermoguttaceae bacterium]